MFCIHCEGERPDEEMKNAACCVDCFRAQKRATWARWYAKNKAKREFVAEHSIQYYHGVDEKIPDDKEWRLIEFTNRLLRRPWSDMGNTA